MKHLLNRGTTLIEMIIYLAISAVLISGVGVISASVIDAKSKTKAVGDVYQAATNIVATIDRATKEGKLLISPPWQSSSSTLTIVNDGVSTSVREDGGALMIGSSTWTAINGSDVKVSDVTFFAVGASTGTAVRMSFGLSASTTGVWQQYNFSETFTTTAVLGNYR